MVVLSWNDYINGQFSCQSLPVLRIQFSPEKDLERLINIDINDSDKFAANQLRFIEPYDGSVGALSILVQSYFSHWS